MNNETKKEKKPNPKKNTLELTKLKEENSLLNDKVLRISAEMQNMKRRTEEEVSKLLKYEGNDIIKSLLPIIDNFERAILANKKDANEELAKFLDGFEMIYASLVDILNKNDVKEIAAQDKTFDPNTMSAVLTAKDETKESNIVLDVLQKGYIYKDKVIRHAMVKVNE